MDVSTPIFNSRICGCPSHEGPVIRLTNHSSLTIPIARGNLPSARAVRHIVWLSRRDGTGLPHRFCGDVEVQPCFDAMCHMEPHGGLEPPMYPAYMGLSGCYINMRIHSIGHIPHGLWSQAVAAISSRVIPGLIEALTASYSALWPLMIRSLRSRSFFVSGHNSQVYPWTVIYSSIGYKVITRSLTCWRIILRLSCSVNDFGTNSNVFVNTLQHLVLDFLCGMFHSRHLQRSDYAWCINQSACLHASLLLIAIAAGIIQVCHNLFPQERSGSCG